MEKFVFLCSVSCYQVQVQIQVNILNLSNHRLMFKVHDYILVNIYFLEIVKTELKRIAFLIVSS
jgi:hypothetical protein